MHKKTFEKNKQQQLMINIEDIEQTNNADQQLTGCIPSCYNEQLSYQQQQNPNQSEQDSQQQEQCKQSQNSIDSNSSSESLNKQGDSESNQKEYYCRDKQYLILQGQNNTDNIFSKNQSTKRKKELKYGTKQQIHQKSFNKSKGKIHDFSQQKDNQIDKIIEKVLIRRKQKQRKKEVLQRALHSGDKNSNCRQNKQEAYNKNTNQTVHEFKSNFGKYNQQTLRDHYQTMLKVKELQQNIQFLSKKKINLQKIHDYRKKQAKEKKTTQRHKNKSKIAESLEKLKDRLQKALQINLKLSKSIKFEKSKLISIHSMSNINNTSKSKYKFSQINEQSTIRNIQNNSAIDSKQGYGVANTFRSADSENLIFVKGLKSPSIDKPYKFENISANHLSRCQDSYILNSHISKQSKQSKDQVNMETAKILQHYKPSQKLYTEKPIQSKKSTQCQKSLKSPILLYNNYSVKQIAKITPSYKKQENKNIYIQDDMIGKQRFEKVSEQKNKSKQILKKQIEQVQKYFMKIMNLEQKQKQLLETIEKNAIRIKQYQNRQFLKAIQTN